MPLPEGPMRVLLESQAKHPKTEYGEYAIDILIRMMRDGRADVERYVADNPEVLQHPVERPVFIAGMYRSGTTHLHRLLSCDPRFRPLYGWESNVPIPPPEAATILTDPRCIEYGEFQESIFRDDPKLAAMHWEPAHLAGEDVRLMGQTGLTGLWPAISHCDEYIEYFLSEPTEMYDAYQWHKVCMQVLQSKAPGRWLNKSPLHSLLLPGLLATYPDARIVRVDRSNSECVASALSMFRHLQSKMVGDNDLNESLYRHYLLEHDRRIKALSISPEQMLTVNYEQLLVDPLAVAQQVSGWAWGDYPPYVEGLQRSYLARHPQHEHGVHEYEVSDVSA